MRVKKILTASVVIWIVSMILAWLTCGWLFKWIYEIPPTTIWTDMTAMTTGALIGSALVMLLGAIFFTTVYAILKKGIPGKEIKKGMTYGALIWLVSAISGIGGMAFYTVIAPAVIIYWIIQSLVFNLINGAIIGAMIK